MCSKHQWFKTLKMGMISQKYVSKPSLYQYITLPIIKTTFVPKTTRTDCPVYQAKGNVWKILACYKAMISKSL